MSSTIFVSLVWLDLRQNPGVPNQWRTFYTLGQWLVWQLNSSKYCYLIPIIQLLYIVKWFQVFLSSTNNYFWYYSFLNTHIPWREPAQTITDADKAEDIALLANTLALAEYLLHRLEHAAGGIGLHVNADRPEYMFFNQRGDIYTHNSGSQKLADKFLYLGSSVSSVENDINTQRHGQLSIVYQS